MKHVALFPADPSAFHQEPLSEEPRIHPTCKVVDSHIGGWTDLMANCTLIESTFDDYSYAAGDVQIIYTDVGKFANIASHVRINPGNHPVDRVTLHHMTYRRARYQFGEDDPAIFEWRRASRCTVGHDTWIGHAAIIMPGVTIGHGAVVGAGAIVTKDVAPYEIVAGVPARRLRMRFPRPVIDSLLRIEWWHWTRAELEARFDHLLDLDEFLKRYDTAAPTP